MRAPPNHLRKAPPSNTVTFRLRNFEGIQSIAQSYCENHKGTKHRPLPANMSNMVIALLPIIASTMLSSSLLPDKIY